MNVFDEFLTIARELERKQVNYALIGGVALAYHGLPRFTKDIDLLIVPDDADGVRTVLESVGYFESAEPWTFSTTGITLRRFFRADGPEHLLVDVMICAEQRHRAIIENALLAQTPDATIRFAQKEDLIWLKRQRNSLQDQADIEGLSNDES